jgi:hypothetical protein
LRCYESDAKEWLATGINNKFNELFDQAKGENGNYIISETLRMQS